MTHCISRLISLSVMSSLVAEKRYKSAKTAVFWDMEDCPLPDGLNAVEVSRNIRKALKKLNYEAKASIYAYGDTDQIKAGLNSTGYVVKQHPDAGSFLKKISFSLFFS